MTVRLHVVSLPHTETTRAYEWCAYTAKVRRFADMMTAEGHEVVLYAGERNEGACAELVPCVNCPPPNGTVPPFDANSPLFEEFNRRAIDGIRSRIRERDIVCLIGGLAQRPIAEAFPAHLVCEFGVGYEGVLEATHRVFESYAWMHVVYGRLYGAHSADGRFFDAVIPNYFDPGDFDPGDGGGGYLLYLGRLTLRKGIALAIDVARAAGLPLKVAGFGEYHVPAPGIEYVGVVGPEQRSELLGGAIALLAPSLYVEPFGGAAVEAQLCGTPAVTSDWGGFTETVEARWRCRTMAEFIDAVRTAATLPSCEREGLRHRATGRYSLDAIGPRYSEYLRRLDSLWGEGFYAEAASRRVELRALAGGRG